MRDLEYLIYQLPPYHLIGLGFALGVFLTLIITLRKTPSKLAGANASAARVRDGEPLLTPPQVDLCCQGYGLRASCSDCPARTNAPVF